MLKVQAAEALKKNYSKAGTALIEKLYGDNFLSLSGERSSDNIIALTNMNSHSRVLDIGSGVGGPAIYFGQRTGCRIIGIDIIEWNVQEAKRRSLLAGLGDRVVFEVGDASSLAFEEGSFDVVVSQDAWCHVPEKRKVLTEAVRMATSDGYVAFTDWVELSDMDPGYQEEVKAAVAAPNFAKPDCYKNWLLEEGCKIISQTDISQHFADRYRALILNLKSLEAEIVEKYNKTIFSVLVHKNELILKAFADSKIGGIEIVAQK